MSDSEFRLRRDPRYRTRKVALAHCHTWDSFSSLFAEDISRGGVFLRTATPPPVGTLIDLQLDLPDGRQLEIGGQVAHVISVERAESEGRSPGMGVRFLLPAGERRQDIEELVNQARVRSGKAVAKAAVAVAGENIEATAPQLADALTAALTSSPAMDTTSTSATAWPLPVGSPPSRRAAAAVEEGGTPPPAAAPVADGLRALRQSMQAELGLLREVDDRTALGVTVDADARTLDSALRRRSHPFEQPYLSSVEDSSVQATADAILYRLRLAHDRLQGGGRHEVAISATAPAGAARARPPGSLATPTASGSDGAAPALPGSSGRAVVPVPPGVPGPASAGSVAHDLPRGGPSAPSPTAGSIPRDGQLRAGEHLVRSGELVRAWELLSDLLRAEPGCLPAQALLLVIEGLELRKANQSERALAALQRAVELDPYQELAIEQIRTFAEEQREERRSFWKRVFDTLNKDI